MIGLITLIGLRMLIGLRTLVGPVAFGGPIDLVGLPVTQSAMRWATVNRLVVSIDRRRLSVRVRLSFDLDLVVRDARAQSKQRTGG